MRYCIVHAVKQPDGLPHALWYLHYKYHWVQSSQDSLVLSSLQAALDCIEGIKDLPEFRDQILYPELSTWSVPDYL